MFGKLRISIFGWGQVVFTATDSLSMNPSSGMSGMVLRSPPAMTTE